VKLFVVVVQQHDADGLAEAMLEASIRFTRIGTAGVFLKQDNVTFVVGIDDEQAGLLLAIIKRHATTRAQIVSPIPAMMESGELSVPHPVEVQVGGATVLGFDVDRFERF